MKYASYELNGKPGVAEVRGEMLIPLGGLRDIDNNTTPEVLSAARRLEGEALNLGEVRLRPVVPHPGKVFCVGLNYMSHVDETKRDLPEYPVLFPKYASSMISATDTLVLPPESKQVDWEGELAAVIGRWGRRIPEDEALDYVLGYSIANDITMRDYQYKTHQWLQGKAWDDSTPIGPFLVTPDEVDIDDARIWTELNGQTVQDSNLSQLIFKIPRLIAVVTEFTEVRPGDIILTGTPGGVGYRRDPQVFLASGDTVTVSIDGLGHLTTLVR